MTAMFEKLLEMSLTAACVILVVLVIRLLLRKAPKKYSYALWSVAAFRLVCPVSFESVFSIFRFANVVERVEVTRPAPSPGLSFMSTPSDHPAPAISVDPEYIYTASVVSPAPGELSAVGAQTAADLAERAMLAMSIVWLIGLAALLIYGVVSYVRLRRRMANAVLLEGNVYQSERVRSPFILGFVRPKIYLPFGLSGEQQSYVLAHERYHIKRLDHIIRPAAFLVLAVHWFNPLVWAAYYLMGRDMEMRCDEKVLGEAENIRKAYSTTLLSFAANRRFPSPSPLAFGETGVKGRIKNILNWKKPHLWVTIAAIVVVVGVILVCAADPADPEEPSTGLTADQTGAYRTAECIYLTPLSSSYGAIDAPVTIGPDSVTWGSTELEVLSGWEELTEERWNELEFLYWEVTLKEKVGEYESQRILALSDSYSLMEMDGELWITRHVSDPKGRNYIWSIYRLSREDEAASAPSGYYQPVECVYMSPLSSYLAVDGDSGYWYYVGNGQLKLISKKNSWAYPYDAEGQWEELTEEVWRELADGTLMFSDPWDAIKEYERPMIRLYDGSYFLLDLDGELWVGKSSSHPNGQGYIWDLYRLAEMTEEPQILKERKATFCYADLNHDGSNELFDVVYDTQTMSYHLTVAETMGMNVLLEWELPSWPYTNEGYYLYRRDGLDYLLYWAPNGRQGVYHWSYEVFSFSENGEKQVLAEGVRQYDTSHIGNEQLTADLEDLRSFEREVNALLGSATPILVSERADGGDILIGGQGGPILWKSPADDWEWERQQQAVLDADKLEDELEQEKQDAAENQ